MKNIKGIVILVVAIGMGAFGWFLYASSAVKYSILVFTVAGVLLLMGLGFLFKNSSPNKAYESTVNGILNTYDSVLVKSNTVPILDDRNIVIVMSMEDLIDAQMEIRKPICYLKQTESCSFVLLDDKEAYIYIEKLKDDVVSPVEIAINESKIRNKNKEEMDSEMLRDIERTTVVKLSNQKSYKVSPIRKKKEDKVEDKTAKIRIPQENVTEVKKEEVKVEENQPVLVQTVNSETENHPAIEEKQTSFVEEEVL